MAHYQHAAHEFELCDRYGLVVWAELCLVNWMTDDDAFKENTRRQLRELIKQNYNHPSFVFISLYNEPGIDKKRGDAEWHFVDSLAEEAHQLGGGLW
jgi:beta-galactosidase